MDLSYQLVVDVARMNPMNQQRLRRSLESPVVVAGEKMLPGIFASLSRKRTIAGLTDT